MERFWNHIYYFIFLFECKTSLLFRKVLNIIFYPITYIRCIKSSLEKKGTSFKKIDKAVTKSLNNSKYGNSITIADIHMGGILALLEYSIFNFIQAFLGKSLIQYIWENSLNKFIFITGLLIMPNIINNHLLWKNDKYLSYFKEFDKEPKEVKQKWAWISLGVVIGSILLLIFSFWVMTKAIY